MVSDLLGILLPLVAEGTAKLVKDKIDELQKQNPGSTPFEAVEKAAALLLSDATLPDSVEKELQNLRLANIIAEISNLNVPLITAAFNSPLASNIREFARRFDTAAIQNVIGDKSKDLAELVRTEVFRAQPTATVQGMVEKDKITLSNTDPAVKAGVINVLSKMKDDFISSHPISALTTIAPEAVKDIPPERLPAVTQELKMLSRVQSISPTTKTMEHLANTGFTSAIPIALASKANFVKSVVETSAGSVSASAAALAHDNASVIVRRNENIFMDLLLKGRGSGLKAIDGDGTALNRKVQIQTQIRHHGLDLNIENLFGSMDQCVCDDCTTVYSAASYYVDLLNYLRNNNLSPILNPNTSTSGQADNISSTVLESLFRRRPDLGNLELTCENTNNVLPYIDLANEVMESFIVNLDSYGVNPSASSGSPQATIDAFNMSEFQDSAEILSQPQNINYNAYSTLATSVYPFTLPYHLPLSASRIFLQFLKVSRAELLDAARYKPPAIIPYGTYTVDSMKDKLKVLQRIALDRQVAAEYLGLVQQEYIILTKEAFFTDEWFNVTENISPVLQIDEYRRRIGVRDLFAYWGYQDLDSMMDTNEDPITGFQGLRFVKNQLLPRSGVSWIDLTQIVQTNFINPLLPKGRHRTLFNELRFSYRFLQTLIDKRQTDPRRRLGRLAEFLVRAQIINVAELLWDPSQTASQSAFSFPSHKNGMASGTSGSGRKSVKNSKGHFCVDDDEVRDWVFNNFENMGKLVVLEFDEGPFLSDGKSPDPGELRGQVFALPKADSINPQAPAGLKYFPDGSIGALSSDGRIKGSDGTLIATVTIRSAVVMGDAISNGKSLNDTFPDYEFVIQPVQLVEKGESSASPFVAWIKDGFLKVATLDASGNSVLKPADWVLSENQGSGCNIDNVRLQHLNGDPLEVDEWDKLHRFIRLWRKLGCSVGEVDRAIAGLSHPPVVVDPASSVGENGSNSAEKYSSGTMANGTIGWTTNGIPDQDDVLITFEDYTTSALSGSPSSSSSGSGTKNILKPDITPYLIEQLSAIIRTLPLISIPLEQLLCLWTDIPTIAVASTTSTTGTKSLYEKLFFTSNLKKNDPIFGPDSNGDYFTGPEKKITDNLPVIMAAFKLKAEDIRFLLGLTPDPFGTANKNPLKDSLNITNLTQIYRMALLSRILGIDVFDVNRALEGFGPAFDSATIFYDFLNWWNTMESLNFPWEELRYIIDEILTPNDPLMPSAISLLSTAKTLNDGIEAIKAQYVVPNDPEMADIECTDDIVKSSLALVCDDATTEKIMGLLDGTGNFSTNKVPIIPDVSTDAFVKKVAGIGAKKLTYFKSKDGTRAQLLCKGILTVDEMESAKELVSEFDNMVAESTANGTTKVKIPKMTKVQFQTGMKNMWLKALESIANQPKNLFNDLIKGIFDKDAVDTENDPQKTTILAGDVDEKDANSPAAGKKPSEKRFFFMGHFIPFLQQTLARTLVSDTVISVVGFNDRTLAKTILENVMVSEKIQRKTIDYLLEILKPSNEDPDNFQGYISVPTNDNYMFIYPDASESHPSPVFLDNAILGWRIYQDDTQRYWATDPTKAALKSGKLYRIEFENMDLSLLEWKPSSTFRSRVPPSSFMPNIALDASLDVFNRLQKTAILVNHFKLSSDELIYILEHKEDFSGMEFHSLSMDQWKRIQAFIAFRDSLPKNASQSLIELFKWSTQNEKAAGSDLSMKIASATNWKTGDIAAILSRINFSDGTGNDFKNEKILVRFSKLISLSTKLGVDIPRLFHWSIPLGTSSQEFFKLLDVSEDIKKVARSKFDLHTWNDAVRPLNDVLREQQKDALIAYLLVQDEVRKQGVIDADSLFEFFLIDVQMTPLVETSRIKQAIATVQVFIQRCFLGLEQNIDPSRLDRARWDWMSKYRVWEANRKIFLYPENWIDPTLRDDKSPFFLKLEGALLQKDLSHDVVASAVKNFLYSVNEVANMEITALCVEKLDTAVSTKTVTTTTVTTTTTTTVTTNPNTTTTTSTGTASSGEPEKQIIPIVNTKIHLFARTSNSPFSYYYISYSMGNWTAWTKMDIEIPFYNTQDAAGLDVAVGTYMSPIVHSGRLLVFIPQITKKTSANPAQTGQTPEKLSKATSDELKPLEQWEIKMSYTELRDGKWMQRQMCPEGVMVQNGAQLTRNEDGSVIFPQTLDPICAIESFAFIAAEILAPDPTSSSNPIPKVPVGVRIIASRFVHPDNPKVAPIPRFTDQAGFMGIGEWDFIDGKLGFYGAGTQLGQTGSVDSNSDQALAAPDLFVPNTLKEIISTNFGYQIGTTSESSVLHSFAATDDRSGTTGPQLDAFTDAPMVAKGKIASALNEKVSAGSKEIFFHKETDPSQGPSMKGTDNMPLTPLYSYLSGVASFEPGTAGSTASTEFKLDPATGLPVNTKGFITDFVPPISDLDETFGGIVNTSDHSTTGVFNERSTPFSIYNWEIGLHAPMLLIDRLLNMQQFEQALNVCHYVFNPLAQGDKTDFEKYWVFAPFKKVVTQTTEEMFLNFRAGQFRQDVVDWRNAPFQPHVVARSRPQAYMMWIAMKYIEILIAYGDFYFRQNSLETIPDAIQLYILASHLYGPRGQKIPRPTPAKKFTYNELATKFDAFSNVMVQLEEAFPFSNQTSLPVGKLPDDTDMPLANLFGFAGTLFFAIPNNPNLRALGDTIDDRLFKIRHSQDINGIFRQLPLFEPPIDPALLVQAAAQGLSISSVLQDLNGPMPNYRFQYLLSRALELAQGVKAFGGALLSARERIDFESLSVLRARHDTITQTVLMDMKKLALDEANKSLEALQYSRNAPVSRLRYYLQQIGADLSGVPEVDREFMELNAKIEKPVAVGGLQLMSSEKNEMDQYALSADLSNSVGVLETIGAAMNMLPNFSGQFEPLGVGGSVAFGGSNIGAYFQAIARSASMDVNIASYQAGTAGRKSQAMRALQDRILQANMAGYEIASIDKHVATNKIKIAMTSKDIDIQQNQIDQMHEVEDFLRRKYSNGDLYSWMEGATRSLFYETYTQAYELAKKAEKAFKFERPTMKSASFIQGGYWDATRDGLLAGEHLYNALKQLEAKYIEDRGYDYEITKIISLRQLDPMSLVRLRTTGICNFDIPEVLFDMDFPGHYTRRLKSVSVSVPCIVGPYTSINSTLRLTAHKIRFQPTNPSGDSYVEIIDPASGPDERFTTSNVPINAIAVSGGQNDSGTFMLNFHDDRYLPFEGAGAISSWDFRLPQHPDTGYKQFNWETITDVIISLKYTSIDGGSQMMQGAQTAVKNYLKAVEYTSTAGGLWAIFDLKNEFAGAWRRFVADAAITTTPPSVQQQPASLDLPKLNEKLPVFASSRAAGSVLANDVYVLSDAAFPGKDLTLMAEGKSAGTIVLGKGTNVPAGMMSYNLDGASIEVGNWKLKLDPDVIGKEVSVKRAWLLVRYTLK